VPVKPLPKRLATRAAIGRCPDSSGLGDSESRNFCRAECSAMKLAPALLISAAAPYLADRYYFFGKYFDAMAAMAHDIFRHVF
jgi:hypothetical protein